MKRVLAIFSLGVFLASCGGPSTCDCVNASREQMKDEVFSEKCEKMEDEWKAKFKDVDEDEQKAMREELKACKDKAKG